MSESSSDTESSCGWTIISNEGSDIEALGPENGLECGSDLPESAVLEPELLQDQLTTLSAEFTEERGESSLNATLKEETLDEILSASEAGGEVAGDEQVTLCSSSDHSDIVTLGDTRETELGPWDEQAVEEEEGAVSEELYLGTSSSSQYTFSAAETARLMMGHWKLPQSLWDLGCQLKGQMSGSCPLSVFPAEQPVVADSSSSSEDEGGVQVTPVVRRRRVRKSTTSSVAEPGEEVQESGPSDREETLEEEQKEVQEEEVQQEPRVAPPPQGHVSSTLNKCILLALVIAISMGFGHFYGTVQVQDRQKNVEKICGVNDLDHSRDLQPQCHKGPNVINKDVVKSLREDLKDKSDMMLSLTGIMDKLTKENQDLRSKQAQLQAQKEDLVVKLKQTGEERVKIESKQSHLMVENQLLKSSLEREEESLSTLQEELRNLRSQIRDLEETGAGTDSILSENQRLKDHLEEETQRLRSFLSQREALMAEAQTLRRELDNERRVTDQLREQLSSRNTRAGGEIDPETEELQSRLMELQKKLSFEQQRSDLWERLYVETKEERAKGDKQAKVKRSKDGVIGKVKDTFDAVKNSTKEFVHHHKEQITKAKEAVKENLRKFSDSVKSTFRHFKDSASRMMDKTYRPHDRRFHERKEAKTEQPEHHRDHGNKDSEEEPWQPRTHKPLHRHPRKSTDDSFQAHRNTRKSGGKVEEDPEAEQQQRGVPKGCSGVFDCAYQESMSLFNKAMDPIRADEFNQLLHSYLQQEVDHFHHWTELESFIKHFFHNGVFIHDQMLFTDFVSGVEDYLEDMDEYHGHNDDVFEDLDEYVYRHFFGDTYSQRYGSSRPFEVPNTDTKEERLAKHQQRNQRARPRSQRERKWSRAGRNTDRHMADVKIELGPMPFDPKY
ncbi:cell cycle progression protein 1 isoform X2 [Oncorhynchus mykiss]|uniref:cell cycle progression protein 1 isoform X2 n=1 Tax=Oncorhynchus mykiss TaxID=8022 RepID=UPI001878162E|nr:cell cycle progression protein 1 isoform X2 [Oncorhynchus mykiss]